MHDPLSPEQASHIVTAVCTLIVASTLCYLVKLLLALKEEFAEMREKMAVHFAEDKSMSEKIERMEENIDRLTKLRVLRRWKETDDRD